MENRKEGSAKHMMMHTLYTKLEWMRELLALDWLTFESDILCLTFG